MKDKCTYREGIKITGVILIDQNDEVLYTKDANGKVCAIEIEPQIQPRKDFEKEVKKKGRIARKIYQRVKELEREAEEYYQELNNPEEGERRDAMANELRDVIKLL